MPQGAKKRIIQIDLGEGAGLQPFGSQIEGPDLSDARKQLAHSPASSLRIEQLKGLHEGTYKLTLIPDSLGGELVRGWNKRVESGLITITDALAGDPAPPDPDNPLWTITGRVFEIIGGPMPHGDRKSYPREVSIVTLTVDYGDGVEQIG